MEIGRREVLAGSAAAVLAGVPVGRADAAANPLAAILSADGSSIEIVHVVAPVGAPSRIAVKDQAGEKQSGTRLVQFLARKADRVAIFGCPPGHKVAERAAGKGGELLYLVQGVVTVKAGTGRRSCGRGTMILCEEGGSFSLEAGPQGYAAIKIRLAE